MAISAIQRGVCVEAAGAQLAGEVHLPPHPLGFVLFASNHDLMRLDRRQVGLGKALNKRGLGTLVFDLVKTTEEAEVKSDVEVLTERLLGAADWSSAQAGAGAELPLGIVGSGLGSAAALVAASTLGPRVCAVATNGGRPDLAGEDLAKVEAATLLIFAGDDPVETEAAIAAATKLRGPQRIRNVPTHKGSDGNWRGASAIGRWLEWHLGSPAVPCQQGSR